MLNYQRVYVRDFVGIGIGWYWIAVSSFYLVIIPSLQQSPKPETLVSVSCIGFAHGSLCSNPINFEIVDVNPSKENADP